MSSDIVYLQKLYSRNANPLKGKKLYERLQRDAIKTRLGYIIRPDKSYVEPKFAQDVVTYDELAAVRPDVIFVEGGVLNGTEWRIPPDILQSEASRGCTVFLCDIDWNVLNAHRQEYQKLAGICQVSIAYQDNEPLELYDPTKCYLGHKQIVCDPRDIVYESWLKPVYHDLQPFVVGNPVPLLAWSELVASCNRSTTRSSAYLSGHQFGEPNTGVFAAACRIGLGYLVFVTGNVSSDAWADVFPGNVEWLSRLAALLVERTRIDRRRGTMAHKLFISHRFTARAFANPFRDELQRRGFGTWLDNRELTIGDDLTPQIRDAIVDCSHFVLLWSADAQEAKWIDLEVRSATEAGKRILLVRLDDTPEPPELRDKLRIEAQALTGAEAGRLIALSIERQERRQKGP